MKTKRMLAVLMSAVIVLGLAACGGKDNGSADAGADAPADVAEEKNAGGDNAGEPASSESANSNLKIAWYAPAPHPYFDDVKKGVEKFQADQGMEVVVQIGPDWTQASENEKVEALVAQGVNALSIYPCDASGANGLYEEISENMGVNVINFGTDTNKPTTAKFAVGTDVKQAAYDATEALIQMMGEEGKILNVLEVLEDPNTALRKEGVEECVAKYPNIEIVQEIAGIKNQEEAVSKIEAALTANSGEIKGIICTGMVTSVDMTQVLNDYYDRNAGAEHIFTIGIDTEEAVMEGIKEGVIDATVAQNNVGHGYIPLMLLKYMGEGYTVKDGVYFVDAGNQIVTKDNIETFQADLDKVTEDILGRLTTDYLEKK